MLFRPPVGNGEVPPKGWYVSNGYANYYELKPGIFAYHTGIDLLLQHGSSAHQPIYAITSGAVTFARRVPNSTWGNLLVIQHTDENGQHFYSRYGHDNDFLIAEGDSVCLGQKIAHVGNAFGQFVYHLHFDISLTETLLTHPADWPGLDLERLYRTYVDPIAFLKGHTLATPTDQIKALADQIKVLADKIAPPTTEPIVAVVVKVDGANVRSGPSTSSAPLVNGGLAAGTALNVQDAKVQADGYTWYRIADGQWQGDYIAQETTSPKA